MKQWPVLLVYLLFLLPGAFSDALANEVKLRCTADTNVSSYPGEAELNYGQSSRLRIKGIQMLGLFQFDMTPIKGWRVGGATLFLRYSGADRKLRTLGFSTISSPWAEGTGAAEKKPGECCFLWSRMGKARWAGPQTDFTDVSYTAGHTLAAYSDVEERADGWIAVKVDPRIVSAMMIGASYGMAVSDEKGQTAANNDVFSREQSNSQPYLVVQGAPAASAPVGAVRDFKASPDSGGATFDSGAIRVTFTAPERAFAYEAEYHLPGSAETVSVPRRSIPFAQPGKTQSIRIENLQPGTEIRGLKIWTLSAAGEREPSEPITAEASSAKTAPTPLSIAVPLRPPAPEPKPGSTGLRIWAYPDTEKAHPVSGNLLEETEFTGYSGVPAGNYRHGNAAWDGRSIQLFGARGEIVAFHLLIEAGTGAAHGILVSPPAALSGSSGEIRGAFQMYRDLYVKDGEWVPEACLPLSGPFDIPVQGGPVAGQKNQSILAELVIPPSTKPGIYRGELSVTASGKEDRIPISLTVNSLVMPNRLSFDVSLNTYGTVGGPFGIDDRTEEYRQLEVAYHRLAHAHRTTLAPLGYSHSGRISSNYAPAITGDGADLRISDWSKWDAQFGPYLDGTAFKGLPRDGEPISHLYTPFHEAWPVDITKHYHYTPNTRDYPANIAEHALQAPPIESAMDSGMADGFRSVVKQWAAHMRERGWTKSILQLYQNDKNYYKDPKTGGQGTSWWLLDEPNFRDDWLALAYFARLLREGMEGFQDVPLLHREDVSRPQWQRNYLDNMVDLMVVSGELYAKGPRLREMRDQWPVRFWTYGEANRPKETNLTAEAWAIRGWLAGADAIVPWQTVGEDGNYEKPDPTAVILPGKRFGIIGPVATLRLKALRRAQQDVEYLVQLAAKRGWDRDQAAVAISRLISLQGAFGQTNSDDAGRFQFGSLHADDFNRLRRAVAASLDKH